MLPSTNRGRCKARGEGGDVVPWAVPLQLWANQGAEGASSVHCSGEGSQGAEMSTLWHPISPLLQQPRPLFKGPHLGLMGSSTEFVSKVLFYFSLNLRDGCCLLSFCQCPLWASVLLARGEAAFQLGYIRLALFQGINFQILDFHRVPFPNKISLRMCLQAAPMGRVLSQLTFHFQRGRHASHFFLILWCIV